MPFRAYAALSKALLLAALVQAKVCLRTEQQKPERVRDLSHSRRKPWTTPMAHKTPFSRMLNRRIG
jgi:hypothetical protein